MKKSEGFVLIMAVLVAAGAAMAQTYVRDGDTVVVDGTPVRLSGLSCDELKTPAGQSQKLVLASLMADAKQIDCTLTGAKTYDREVGWCSLDGRDIGEIMIETTGCQPCRRYDEAGKYTAYPVTGWVPNYCKER